MNIEPRQSSDQAVRIMQILVGVLMMGLIMFAGVGVALVRSRGGTATAPTPAMNSDVLLIALAAMWPAGLAGVLVARTVMHARLRQAVVGAKSGDEALAAALPALQTSVILRSALMEGPGLFGGVIYLISGNWLGLVATGLSLVVMAAMFPTKGRLLDLVESAMGRRTV